MMLFWALVISGAGGYLLGSIPSGFLAGRLRGVDLRTRGSGNVGATNSLRVLGKVWGYAVFAVDFFKGVLAAVLAAKVGEWLVPDAWLYPGIAGSFAAVLGHNFPVWLGFRGGKGIATSGGVMLGLFPLPVFLSGLAAWLLVFSLSRYVSLASLAAAVSFPVSSFSLVLMGWCDPALGILATAMALLAFWKHRENITRLVGGTEKRFERAKKHSNGNAE
jgi:acyl phosphate:glycerol-3-phosphate acyltransferase